MMFEKCEQCHCTSLFHDHLRGEIICESCGLVLKERIMSLKPDWRAYDSEELQRKSRVGQPATPLNNRNMSTIIEKNSWDALGNPLPLSIQRKFIRLSRINNRTHEKLKRNLQGPIIELKRIKAHLSLSDDIGETALTLYRMALSRDLVKGRSVNGMIGAAVYLACRKKKVVLTMKDLCKVITVSYKQLGRSIRVYLQYLKISGIPHDLGSHVFRLGDSLRLTMFTKKVALKILNDAHEKNLTIGKSPMSLAAAAVYIATLQTGEKRTQSQVANAALITPVTIRNRYKEFIKRLVINDVVVKRGAGAKSVIIKDPTAWTHHQIAVGQS